MYGLKRVEFFDNGVVRAIEFHEGVNKQSIIEILKAFRIPVDASVTETAKQVKAPNAQIIEGETTVNRETFMQL